MRNKTVFAHLLSFISIAMLFPMWLFANDGVFYAHGNTLIPVKETIVRLDREVLQLTRDGEYVVINIHFEFFNPGIEKDEIVGFVTPPAEGDVSDEQAEHPQITNFTVNMNGEELPFKIFRMDGSGFTLPEEVANGNDFIYHFNAHFRAGLNIIRHSYRFRAEGWVEAPYIASYVLTTGKMWANGEIGDFTLEVDMGSNCFFTVPWTFSNSGKAASWAIAGKGRLAPEARTIFENTQRVVSMDEGKLILHEKHFQPDSDLSVTEYYLHNEVYLWTSDFDSNPLKEVMFAYMTFNPESPDFSEFTVEQLRLLRNYLYARHGYVFKDAALKKIFSQCLWYKPAPGLALSEIELSDADQTVLKFILEEEARRK
jgi:YARHG domain